MREWVEYDKVIHDPSKRTETTLDKWEGRNRPSDDFRLDQPKRMWGYKEWTHREFVQAGKEIWYDG